MPRPQSHLTVYALTEIGPEKSIWDRVGAAFRNRDGSINVTLRALPTSGRLQIREETTREEEQAPAKETARDGARR